MAHHNRVVADAFIASGDLSGLLHRGVDLLTNAQFKVGVAGAGRLYGVLNNKPRHGEHASVVTEGETEVRVGAAVQAGNLVTTAASGWFVAVTSGANQDVAGRVITGAASGMIATINLDIYRVNTG